MHEFMFMKKANFKGHLLTAISYLIPVVCGAGFIIAIGMAFGGKSQDALVMGGTIPCQVDTYKNENTIFLIRPNRGNIPPRFGHFF